MYNRRPKFGSEIQFTGSSVIKKVRYDVQTATLDVKLKSGQAYRYREIASYDFASLVSDQSSGKIYNTVIKKSWTGQERKATKIRNW